MSLGEVGEQASDELRRLGASERHCAPTELDGDRILASAAADPGEVPEHHGVDVRTGERLVHGESGLVAVDRSLVVAHRLVHRSHGVQDAPLVDDVVGRPVDLERMQAGVERFGVVARPVVDHTDQVQ